MATVRVNLMSLDYPDVAPNSILVLQSLRAAGYKLIMRNVYYKNKERVIDYFEDRNLKISFIHVRNPEIDIVAGRAVINGDVIRGDNNSLWERVDQYCLEHHIYEREQTPDVFIPSYKEGFFVVTDYGLNTQAIDSKPISLKACHTKGAKMFKANPSINTIDLVNATTLEVVEHFDKKQKCFVAATEKVYFSIMV